MRALGSALVGLGLAAASLVAGPPPAAGVPGAFHPRLQIDVVVNADGDHPTGALQVRRTCTPTGNATTADSAPFTAGTVDLMVGTGSFLSGPPQSAAQSCTVSVLQDGGMDVSFDCATVKPEMITCAADATVSWVSDDGSATLPAADRTATVTVTFDAPEPTPEPEPTPTPPPDAVEVAPTFTG